MSNAAAIVVSLCLLVIVPWLLFLNFRNASRAERDWKAREAAWKAAHPEHVLKPAIMPRGGRLSLSMRITR